jgi:hypothetical protein
MIAGGLTGAGIISVALWVMFAQSKVNCTIESKWNSEYRKETVRLADSVTQSYTNDIYEKITRTYFNTRSTMTEKQKMDADNEYLSYKSNCMKKERRMP